MPTESSGTATNAALDIATDRARLCALDRAQLAGFAGEIRSFLVEKVARTGGHLGSNLGIVELTIALHRVFESPKDRILFDVGHQSYVHKILTGRAARFGTLRQRDGLSGYPSQTESAHDVIENSHASTALSYADGIAKAWQLKGITGRSVVAVIGDGALTGGMAFEGLNNLAAAGGRPVIVVLNDNGRSYSPSIGGLPAHLAGLAEDASPNVFTALGFAYLGPVDGHDVQAVENALRAARALRRPVLVHCRTEKGRGYPPAETEPDDLMHTVPVIDPESGNPVTEPKPSWTDAFGAELLALGARRPDLVCVSAAMPKPVGLGPFAERYPERVFDVGIAEQHAVTSAAGLALAGMHPVVALYATFLNRAYDQVLLDVALHRLPVTFTLDRAGITGPDGASHHGMWDTAFLTGIPGSHLAAPRDASRLRELLGEAVATTSGPTFVRFPKANLGADVPAVERIGSVDVLYRAPRPVVLLAAMGPVAGNCVQAAEILAGQGIPCTVADPRWIAPPSAALLGLLSGHRMTLTVEDSARTGGAGAVLAQAAVDNGIPGPVHNLGLPRRFLPHAGRAELLAAHGYTPQAIADAVRAALGGRTPYRHRPDRA
ncbi:1-deoxy-D-xylulose-5-phosphate synthase [Sciscionella sediminilitoris]|uniref:1-deoxy-D-xylulose-5-phosphate synthase n=1 Tax=Sciscionella sediminilitoris TaxID=1445613 RepID=UPI0009EBF5A9|nr:1-deoxy-D-xylulose-5-phosphate synthase [Sciscionella sp. SE31]